MKTRWTPRLAIAFLSFSEILLICFASELLSRTVDQISLGHARVATTLPTIIAYGLSVYLSTVLNISAQVFLGFERVASFASAWAHYIPWRVSLRQRQAWERFFVAVGEQIPKIYELELGIILLVAQMTAVYAMLTYRAIATGRYELLLLSAPLILLNIAANFVSQKPWRESLAENQEQRAEFLEWHRRYFNVGGALAKHWNLENHKDFQTRWLGSQIGRVKTGLVKTQKLLLFRVAAKSVLCDLPFYMGICYFLYLGVIGEISVGAIFFWLTMNELLFRANSFSRELLNRWTELKTIRLSTAKELRSFASAGPSAFAQGLQEKIAVPLLSQEIVELRRGPGVQWIQAANGSGKSYLLQALAGEDLDYQGPLEDIRALFGSKGVLSISAEFELAGLSSARAEIFGPREPSITSDLSSWPSAARLPEHIRQQWQTILRELLHKYPTPAHLRKVSKGEAALLTMARALTFVEEAQLILVDEVDGPLTPERRRLIYCTVEALAERTPTIAISHHRALKMSVAKERAYLLGYDEKRDKGHAIPFLLQVTDDGAAQRTAIGNVGQELRPLIDLALEVLCSGDSSYRKMSSMSFALQCHVPGARITGIDSAGLAVALALVNLKRKLHKQVPFAEIAATGHFDLGGNIYAVAGLAQKRIAAHRHDKNLRVISPEEIRSVLDLEVYLSANGFN